METLTNANKYFITQYRLNRTMQYGNENMSVEGKYIPLV